MAKCNYGMDHGKGDPKTYGDDTKKFPLAGKGDPIMTKGAAAKKAAKGDDMGKPAAKAPPKGNPFAKMPKGKAGKL